ncbi:MAG: hypothetical protein KKE37_07190 [Verrucomicrobia bacterium]|nr:hypothetical protein [Verrucomicrobiota bacterium]MBU4247021.1 hypothetical protein [Verrucomicrobiota bacterium]MBU4290329.1 hypothetical protein [Verrucomicrobiota bacterium]MBU4429122.1 hypothetical protein [Verrucomicrobiota bacterium]MCG2681771.1 hypothetical protein [Kiritimatiellia bacterium]
MDEVKVDVKFGEWIRQGFELFKANAVVLIVASLLALVIGGATGFILSGPMFAGVILIALALVDKKEPKPDIGAVFKGFDYFLNTFLFCLVWGILVFVVVGLLSIIVCVGHLLAVVLVIGLKTMLMFALFLIVDRKLEFWPASMASINRVKGNFFPLLAFMLIASLFNAIGFMVCGLGLIVTLPITICCLAVAYRDVFGPAPVSA